MSARTPTFPKQLSVISQIVQLPKLPMTEIKKIWLRLFHDITPTHNRQFLERRIAFKLQEIEFRKENHTLMDRNQKRISALINNAKMQLRERDCPQVPATVLSREYQNIFYQVVTTADGRYEFQGRVFKSLSVTAREITGTGWSGPLFFLAKRQGCAKSESQSNGQCQCKNRRPRMSDILKRRLRCAV